MSLNSSVTWTARDSHGRRSIAAEESAVGFDVAAFMPPRESNLRAGPRQASWQAATRRCLLGRTPAARHVLWGGRRGPGSRYATVGGVVRFSQGFSFMMRPDRIDTVGIPESRMVEPSKHALERVRRERDLYA